MIKLEHTVLPSANQMQFVIEGMRNPMNSWEKSDSNCCAGEGFGQCRECDHPDRCMYNGDFYLGENDHSLMQRLSNAGTDHRKYLRMMSVYVRITAPLYWWKEFDTYKVGTVANSCSTMHKIQEKEFTLDDFSHEHLVKTNLLDIIIDDLNSNRTIYNDYDNQSDEFKAKFSKKDVWWQMIQLLPTSYNQTRNVMLNYEVLTNIYKSRKHHKLDEWREFCKWIEMLPLSDLITHEVGKVSESDNRKEDNE